MNYRFYDYTENMACLPKACVVFLVSFVIFGTIFAKGGTKGHYYLKLPEAGELQKLLLTMKNGYFVIRKRGSYQTSSQKDETVTVLSTSLQIESLEQMKYLNRKTRSAFPGLENITNSAWSDMWHVQEDTFPSMKVFEVWRRGYSGEGIHINILDNGVEPDHPDLIENYGRNGLGPIYTWAAGNGGMNDDCNCDGYTESIYTITVTSIARDQAPSWYSEECSNILVGTYSGDSPDLRIDNTIVLLCGSYATVHGIANQCIFHGQRNNYDICGYIATTDVSGGCTTSFQGTSASCPMAAGIIALVLEANPTLSWSDIQHLIVDTSTREGVINATWYTNGAGFKVSHVFGFGMLNADGMVGAAHSWQNVGQQVICESETNIVNKESGNGVYITEEHVSNGCTGSLKYLEHVEVVMSFHATYRGSIEITLDSPSGTKSRLLRFRRLDRFNGTTEWTFMTVHNWGEQASGAWTLQLETSNATTAFGLNPWKLILYGTKSAPAYNAQVHRSRELVCKEDGNTGAIIGGVLGGVALLGVAAALVYVFVIRKAIKD